MEERKREVERKVEELYELQGDILQLRETKKEKSFESQALIFDKLKEIDERRNELHTLLDIHYDKLVDYLQLEDLGMHPPHPHTAIEKNPMSKLLSSRKASARWNKVLNVVSGAVRWKTDTEKTRKDIQTAEEIMERNPGTKMTKEEILNLRTTLYRLRQKKSLTDREEALMKNLSAKLHALENELTDTMRVAVKSPRSSPRSTSPLFND